MEAVVLDTNKGASRRHDQNDATYAKKRPIFYVSIVDELVDLTPLNDPNSMDNRKMKDLWFGPYQVVSRPTWKNLYSGMTTYP